MKTVECILHPAESMTEFWHYHYGEKRRNIGMQYFLENSNGELEMYTIHESTNNDELKWFVKNGKCFLTDRNNIKEVGK